MAWRSKPATLSTGIRHGPAVRATGDSGSRQGGHAGQADRLLAPGFAPLLLPGRTVSVLLATGRDPQHRAELRELPCRKPAPKGCTCLRCKRSEAIFQDRNMPLTCGNVRISRLGMTCADGLWLAGCPQVSGCCPRYLDAAVPVRGRAGRAVLCPCRAVASGSSGCRLRRCRG